MEWLALALIAFIALVFWIEYRPRSPEEQASRAYEKWLNDCIRRGMTSQQIRDESMFRRAFASLRQRATEAAIKWPEGAYDEARRIAVEEAESLAFIDKAVARRFLKVVQDSPWSEIFYPEALKAIDLWWKKNGPTEPARSMADLQIDIAAFTTAKD
jgi:hypothetical protein